MHLRPLSFLVNFFDHRCKVASWTQLCLGVHLHSIKSKGPRTEPLDTALSTGFQEDYLVSVNTF